MATSKEFIEYVCDRVAQFGAVNAKKMFGEYIVYIDAKPVLLVCDNTVFVKKLPELSEIMSGADCGFPYDGAKEHYILDTDDENRLSMALDALPFLTPEKKNNKKTAGARASAVFA